MESCLRKLPIFIKPLLSGTFLVSIILCFKMSGWNEFTPVESKHCQFNLGQASIVIQGL